MRSSSTPSAGPRPTSPGWTTSRTGASPASSGGATASRSSTARTAAGRTPSWRTRTSAPSAAGTTSTRTRTFSTRGSRASCGPSPRRGWPDDTSELAEHHPTKVLVTARDIIALWVARMIMSSLYFVGEVPFHDGLHLRHDPGQGRQPHVQVQGQRRRPDGAHGEVRRGDAMRYNLLTLITNNQDVKFDANIDKKTHQLIDSPRTEQARGFVTKIWNASRFVPDEPRGLRAGRTGCRHARGRVDAQSPGPRRRARHRAAGDLRLRRLRARDSELLSGATSATGTSSSARAACSTARPPSACRSSATSSSCSTRA